MHIVKKILYSLITLFILGSITESLLFFITDNKEKKNIQIVKNLHQDAWIHYRDQSLPNAFEKKKRNIWTIHPTYRKRGLPETKIINPKRGLRLLALGGSTTVGIPFEKEIGGFPKRLEGMLEKQKIQVINAAVPGMASRSFSKITTQIQDLEIDAVLIYTGNNEHSSIMYSHCLERQTRRTPTQKILQQLHIYRFLQGILSNKVSIDIKIALERQEDCLSNVARLVHQKQPNSPLRKDMLRDEAIQNFEKNLSQIVTSHKKTPFFLAIPPINYQTPPNLSLLSPIKSKDELRNIEKELQSINLLWKQRLYGKIRKIAERLYSAHPEYALINYHLGMSEIRVGKEDLGLKHLQDALEQDWQPERVTPDLQKVLMKICAKYENAICVNVDKRFKELAVFEGIPGRELFVDYCHPTKELGTNEIASVFLRTLIQYDLGIKNDNQPQDNDQ